MSSAPALVIAGNGSRDLAGVRAAHAFLDRVRVALPGVRVEIAFVELTPPSIEESLAEVLADHATAVVVPLMIGAGKHVDRDIPAAVARAEALHPHSSVVCTPPLGAPESLRGVTLRRIAEAAGDADPSRVRVVAVSAGSSTPETNADHVQFCRLIQEQGGYAAVAAAFLQVTRPGLTEVLDEIDPGDDLVVLPQVLFPGRLRGRVRDQTAAWSRAHPEVRVHLAEVIGPCPELVEVVLARYREGATRVASDPGSQAYLAGLLLRGRRVVVVGGGRVAARRVPRLLQAGAVITVVAPRLHADLAMLATSGDLSWLERGYRPGDTAGAWYVMAATDQPPVNAAVAAEAETNHTFCVRSDDAWTGSAWTPVTGDRAGVTVAALARRDPRRSVRIRDRIIALLADEDL
ncbi:MAG: CbiX/SirB N-terminal domain-containing protein [Propioniciclava sp.]